MFIGRNGSIIIWSIDYIDTKTNECYGHEYYLFYKKAKKRLSKLENGENPPDLKYSLGGEPLWLW